jgi:hypothetical protein
MKRTYFPGITDIVDVTDPAEIRTISNDSRFDRDFIEHGPVRNVLRLRKMRRIFSLNGRLFPTLLPRTNPSRAAAQDELWSRLNVKADEIKHGPAELEPLAEWVRGIGTAEKLDLLVQQSIGRLFVETFTATEESVAAAHTVLEAASSSNVLRMLPRRDPRWIREHTRSAHRRPYTCSLDRETSAVVNHAFGLTDTLHTTHHQHLPEKSRLSALGISLRADLSAYFGRRVEKVD